MSAALVLVSDGEAETWTLMKGTSRPGTASLTTHGLYEFSATATGKIRLRFAAAGALSESEGEDGERPLRRTPSCRFSAVRRI